jgi:hypothetical protein
MRSSASLPELWRSRARVLCRLALPVALMLTLPACLVVISTSPSAVDGATIVFVAIDDRGLLVASLSVTVVEVDGDWRGEGTTARDGAFRCAVAGGVRRVRASVRPPSGFALSGSDNWPREIDLPTSGDVEVRVQLASTAR